MRTAIFMLSGFAALSLAILLAWHLAPRKHAATALVSLAFIPLWLAAAGANMWSGMAAGYSLLGEAPVFLAIFLPPALLAAFIHRRFRHG